MTMTLNCLGNAVSLEEAKKIAEEVIGLPLRLIPVEMSIFEQYIVRPVAHIWIKEIWKYRIIAKHGKYYFGTAAEWK